MSQSSQDAAIEQGGTGAVELSESERYRLLKSPRRRRAIAVLASDGAPVELGSLAAAVASRDRGVDAPDSESVDRLAIELHHNHLPKLDEIGVVDYDREETRVVGCRIPLELSPH